AADVVAVAAGGVHSMALKADGRVFCWGGNEHGQAGIGEGPATVPWAPLGQVPGIADAVAIAAGRYHSLALLADGSLRVWGRVDQASVREPVPLAGPGCGTRVAARSESSVVLREGGSAWSVGGASPKRLAPGRTFAAIAPGLGVTGSGVVVDLATGDGVAGAPLASMAVAGDKLGAALALDGHPWTWGRSGVGALGRGFVTIESPAEPNLPPAPVLRHRKVTAVDAGPYHTAVVRDDGTLWVAGRLTSATRATGLQLVRGIDRVAKAAVGMDVVAVLRDDGSVWRVSLGGQAAVPVAGLGGVVATDVSMTYAHTLVLDTTGQVWCWGYNLSANCGLGHTDSPVSSPTRVPGLAGVVAIAAGELHSLALTADDRVWGWGKADAGRLGGALSGVQLSPATLVDAGGAPIRGLADVAADSYNSMGIKGDGSVVTWGSGDRGALGNGTDGGVALTPVAVPVSGVASALGSGKRIGAALVAAQVVAWGDWPVEAWPASPFVVGGAEAVVAMALGARHGVALTTDRAVLSWGWNDDAQLQNGGGAGVVAAPVICWDCGLPGCAADEDCAAPGFPFCDAATGGCVACRDDSHCTAPALPACVAGLGVCVACVGRSHCTDPALPACHENACVECTESTDCPAGEVCSASAMTCGPCSVDAECPGETPHCASSTGLCVECTSAGHCPAGESCLPDGTCGTCSEDAHCPTGKHCSEGRCVNCVDSLDCPGDLVCRRDLDLCLGWCNADDQCIKNPAKPACFLAYGSCVECTADVHCGGGKPACDQSSRVCVACTSNAQCGGEKPVCLAKSKCVECATNADCPSGKPVCDTSYYRCAVCKKDSDCPLPDSRCVTTPLTSEKACLEACTRNDPACPAGQACLYRTGSETLGFCGPASCTDFFADECGPLANCLPAGSGGTCVAAGYWGAGSQCTDHTGCYPGLLCLDRKCNVPACTPGGAPACVDGKTCIPAFTPSAMLDVGFCASECVPGAPGCWDSCRPTHVEVATGTMVWACLQETGTRTLGQSCTPGSGVYSLSCRAPNVCLGGPEGAFCREPCNPAAAPGESGCDGAVCTPLGDATLVGGCKPCVPFGGGGCEPGAWCSPDWYAPASGACVVLSGAEVGEGKPCGLSDCCAATCYDPTVRGCTCAADAACCAAAWPSACANVARSSCGLTCLSPVCGEGLLCVGGRCEVLCVPGAAAGAPGACAGGDYCARLSSGSTPLGIGECRPACDLAGGKLCDEGQACQSAVVTQATVDVCFAGPPGWPGYPAEAGEPCPLSAPSYGYCGDARVCVGSPATCTNLCLTKNGAFGAGHPDCSDGAETVCTKVFTTSSYGLCKAP
ncbi:MAG: hypothetical protein FJ087_20375, partial [Deltaproteobacteria bacterium]|nr:hypothetical protein [Deltaproteobacteria bacterium]